MSQKSGGTIADDMVIVTFRANRKPANPLDFATGYSACKQADGEQDISLF